MVCPKCLTQMFQWETVGGGVADEREYRTWEVKQCPLCGRKCLEFYCAASISDDEARSIKDGGRRPVFKPISASGSWQARPDDVAEAVIE